eukprot:CAMPEP_0202501500 /NCGR_PEP_ID=MMETSP1361-20130828/36373_1 /ASSEMBLY_ACC=CAM_ASM_000849 /TAXON_ID=210615 /ORGANISM="Staurosira complex sp., Strain CCMP2646" /LENGTH=32 /DNA_ID= /DNA_START= /DNA_END= /DNA_ORIENTATION=
MSGSGPSTAYAPGLLGSGGIGKVRLVVATRGL